jgi:hypothetical protein
MRKALVRMLSIHISFPIFQTAVCYRGPCKQCLANAYGTGAHVEHTRQELMHMLSICISSLRVCSACASKTQCGLAPSKIKIIN